MSGFIQTLAGVAYHISTLGDCCGTQKFGTAWVLSMDQVRA